MAPSAGSLTAAPTETSWPRSASTASQAACSPAAVTIGRSPSVNSSLISSKCPVRASSTTAMALSSALAASSSGVASSVRVGFGGGHWLSSSLVPLAPPGPGSSGAGSMTVYSIRRRRPSPGPLPSRGAVMAARSRR